MQLFDRSSEQIMERLREMSVPLGLSLVFLVNLIINSGCSVPTYGVWQVPIAYAAESSAETEPISPLSILVSDARPNELQILEKVWKFHPEKFEKFTKFSGLSQENDAQGILEETPEFSHDHAPKILNSLGLMQGSLNSMITENSPILVIDREGKVPQIVSAHLRKVEKDTVLVEGGGKTLSVPINDAFAK